MVVLLLVLVEHRSRLVRLERRSQEELPAVLLLAVPGVGLASPGLVPAEIPLLVQAVALLQRLNLPEFPSFQISDLLLDRQG